MVEEANSVEGAKTGMEDGIRGQRAKLGLGEDLKVVTGAIPVDTEEAIRMVER